MQVRHRYVEPGEYRLQLTVSDDAGVANSRGTETRRVTVSPGPEVALADPGPLCPGAPHLWSAPAPDGVTAAWDFAGVDKATAEKIEHVFDEPGVFPVSVTLDDGAGPRQQPPRRAGLRARQPARPPPPPARTG